MSGRSKIMMLLAVVLIAAVGVASAGLVVSYESGVTAAAGQAGAADPTSQGWSYNSLGGNSYAIGQDTGNGGWNITDGTSSDYAWYGIDVSSSDADLMESNGWSVEWTVAVNHDAISSGDGTGVDNYYTSANQNDNAVWIEFAGGDYYYISHRQDSSDNILINDGTSDHTVTGMSLSEQRGSGSPSMDYVTFTLSSDGSSATMGDSLGNSYGTIAKAGTGSSDRLIFGATSGGGQGSTVWNNIAMTAIPEPATIGLLGLIGIACLIRRKLVRK